MTNIRPLVALMAAALLTACTQTGQSSLEAFGRDLGYNFTMLSNRGAASCVGQTPCDVAQIKLTLPDKLPKEPWAIYLSLVAPFDTHSEAFDVVRLNGDLYRITPKTELTPGETYVIGLRGNASFKSEYFPMPNAFVAAEGLKPVIIAATKPIIDPETGLEILPFVTPYTDEAALAATSDTDATRWLTPERAFELNARRAAQADNSGIGIIPLPAHYAFLDGAAIDFNTGYRLTLSGVEAAALSPALKGLGKASASGPEIQVTVGGQGAPESYQLVAADGKVVITAPDAAGAFYGLMSLSQQMAHDQGQLRPLQIKDAPRFGFRGMHLDLSRNFTSKAHVLSVIEQMGRYKLNRLHLHLGDDEGWRLEIEGLPELTDVGGFRCHDLKEDTCLQPQLGAGPFRDSPVNGYFSAADYIDILKAAKANQIEVIPSFDMPGHSRAAIISMEARYRKLMAAGQPEAAAQYRLVEPEDTTVYSSIQAYNDNTLNVCIEPTYAFIEKVIDGTRALHDRAGVPLKRYHIGLDETAGAWKDSPACKALMEKESLSLAQLGNRFVLRVTDILTARNIEPAGWSDGMGHVDATRMPKVVQSNAWGMIHGAGIAEAHTQANQGWDIVLSTPDVMYFDMPWAPDPKERGYDWASRGTDLYKIFAFQPENLPASASMMVNTQGITPDISDTVPLKAGARITGMQGQLWSETVRGDTVAQYMIYPRLLVLAERAWHRADWETPYSPGRAYAPNTGADGAAVILDWNRFQSRLAPHMAQLDKAGIAYYLPVPGARVKDGRFEANLPFAGPSIEYRTAGGQWTPYRQPVALSGRIEVRSRAPNGQRAGRSVMVD